MPDLPCDTCRGKCCTYPIFTRVELKRLLKAGIRVPEGTHRQKIVGAVILTVPGSKLCPFLADGRCSIYDLRPQPCRDYGVEPSLPCEVVDPEGAERQAVLRMNRLGPGFLNRVGWKG